MTILPPIADRNALNIDTHERALIYAALLLRKANQTLTDTKYKNAVRVTTSETQNTDLTINARIILEAKFPYSSQQALGFGGNFIENVSPFSSINPNPLITEPLTTNSTNLGDDPDYVTNLERYFCFHALQWQKAMIADGLTGLFNYCKAQFFEEDPIEPSFKISASIPYNYSVYTTKHNLLQSLTWIGSVIKYVNITANCISLNAVSILDTTSYLKSLIYLSISAIDVTDYCSLLSNIIYHSNSSILLGNESLFGINITYLSENEILEISDSSYIKTILYASNSTVNVINLSFYVKSVINNSLNTISVSNDSNYSVNITDPYFNNVVLYLKGDGVNDSINIVDDSPNIKTIIRYGDTKISTNHSKYGGTCIYFDGNSDYLSIPSSSDFNFGNNMTIELWFKTSQTTGYATLLNREWSGDYVGGWTIFLNGSTGCPEIWWADFSTNIPFLSMSGTSHTDNIWHHLAWSKSGNVHRFFLDGIQKATITVSTVFASVSKSFGIGNDLTFGAGARVYNGYIDSLRLTNLNARYLDNFNPETDTYLVY